MADDKQDDMSMDEILSSIKDILSDDVETKKAEPAEIKTEIETVVEPDLPVFDDSDDDVLDLTSAMRVDIADDPITLPQPEEEEISADSLFEVEDDDEIELPVIESIDDLPDLPSAAVVETAPPSIENNPMIEEEPDPVEELVQPEEEDFDLEEELEQKTEEVVLDDVSDASDDIINNFQKIFANAPGRNLEQPAPQAETLPVDTDAALVDLVKTSVQTAVSKWVEENLSNQDIAKLLEELVKKEVARVMAKADKN